MVPLSQYEPRRIGAHDFYELPASMHEIVMYERTFQVISYIALQDRDFGINGPEPRTLRSRRTSI